MSPLWVILIVVACVMIGLGAWCAAGVTILYISHYMEEVQALCPRVGVMDHGRLVAYGEVADLVHQLDGLIRINVPAVSPASSGPCAA